MATKKVFQVTKGPLSVREEPGGQWLKQYSNGTKIVVNSESRTESGGYVWWQHSEGWSAEGKADGSRVFMEEVVAPVQEEADTAAKKETSDAAAMEDFAQQEPQEPEPEEQQVTMVADGRDVRIRTLPDLSGDFVRWIPNGSKIKVDLSTRTESDGFVWVQHSAGWSAECTLGRREVFLKELEPVVSTETTTDDAPSAAEPVTVTTSAAPAQGAKELQAKQDVRVRRDPSLSGAFIKWIPGGSVVEFDMDSETTADGYLWLKHSEGWSAWQKSDGSSTFLVEVGSVADVPTMTDSGPDVTTLPGYKTLIQRLPVDLNNTAWWQYFGNNTYAYKYGEAWGYGRYAQGLHSGLDFGNNSAGIPVYAGLEGTYSSTDRYGFKVKHDNYTIIYQHLCNMVTPAPGSQITPYMKLGELDASSPQLRHLHFEIRYKGTWIINPLLFMPDEMVNSIIAKFDPKRSGDTVPLYYFYTDNNWNQWLTPLDQPVIKLGGPLIGPLAR